ncbi:MAG: DUF711 family protein [Sulfolobales archaeon]
MPMVRALTLHVKSEKYKPQELVQLLGDLKKSIESRGISVWTLRASFSEDLDWREAISYCGDKVMIAAYHKSVDEVRVSDLVEYLKKCGNGYATILATEDNLEYLSRLYVELSRILSEDYFTRIGVSYGSYVQTPYFPISTAREDSVSVAYRYIDLLLSSEPNRWTEVIQEITRKVGLFLKDVAGGIGLRVYHDISISPWMTESSVDVVEKLGAVFPEVGTLGSVYRVNRILTEASSHIESTGFNELMMPVAEDDRLKELVKRGKLRLENLIGLSTACVAGLDMVAVPRDLNYLKNLFADTYTAFSIKKRPYGVRIVPTDKPVVELTRFGELPAFSSYSSGVGKEPMRIRN